MKALQGKLSCQTDGEGGRGALFLSLVQMSKMMALANGYGGAAGAGSTRRWDSGGTRGRGCAALGSIYQQSRRGESAWRPAPR